MGICKLNVSCEGECGAAVARGRDGRVCELDQEDEETTDGVQQMVWICTWGTGT
jgi:hypothetical protein